MPDPDAVMRSMAEAYASLASYQDEGFVRHRFGYMPFVTLFKRPNYFRFEWVQSHPYHAFRSLKNFCVLWSDGKKAHCQSEEIPKLSKRNKSLSLVIAGATGISHGAAHTVSCLLMNEVTGFRLSDLKSCLIEREEVFEAAACHVVTGTHPRTGHRYELWIGKQDHLLRQVANGRDREIRSMIRVDHDIPDMVFAPMRTRAGKVPGTR